MVRVVWKFPFHVFSAQLQQHRGNIFSRLLFCTQLVSPIGCSVACCLLSCWRPGVLSHSLFLFRLQWRYLSLNCLKISQVLWNNASNKQGVTLTLMWCFSIRHMIAGVSWIFYKSSFNELARLCLSFHFAGGLITSSLFINEDMAPGRGRSEVILVASVWTKGEIAQIVVLCRILNDAHAPLGV